MTDLATNPLPTTIRTGSGKQRDRLPERLISLAEFMNGEAIANDDRLEEALAIVVTGMRDGSIRLDVGKDLMVTLGAVLRDNDHIHDVLLLMREANMEVAQREVERIQNKRKAQAKAVNKKP